MEWDRGRGDNRALELVVLQGTPSGRWVLRDRAPLKVGSGRDADLVLDDQFVSQVHGRLDLVGGRWHYLDVGSKNGSQLYRGGTRSRIAPGSPGVELQPGDALRLGTTLLGVRAADDVTPDLLDEGSGPEITATRPLDVSASPTVVNASVETLFSVDVSTASPEGVLDTAVQVMRALFGDAGRIHAVQLDGSGTRPLRHACSDPRSPSLGLGPGLLERVALGNEVVVVRSESHQLDRRPGDPGRSGDPEPSAGRHCLCAPLQIGDGTRGLLLVDRPGNGTFTDAELDAIAGVAVRTALALSAVALRTLRARELDSRSGMQMAAHDFGNGLTTVLGALGYLAETNLGREQREAVHDALLAARWLTTLNRTFLDLHEMRAGQLAPTMRPVVLSAEVEQALALVRRLFEIQGVALTADVPAGLEAVADPDLLRRVLVNLLGNASRHAPRASVVTISARAEDAAVRLSVHDDGAGIDPAIRPHLFERRTQGAQPGMMGIGLLFCRTALERMGGTIAVDDVPVGSTFSITLCPARSRARRDPA